MPTSPRPGSFWSLLFVLSVSGCLLACQQKPKVPNPVVTHLHKECKVFGIRYKIFFGEFPKLAHAQATQRQKAYALFRNAFRSDWYQMGCRMCFALQKEATPQERANIGQMCRTRNEKFLGYFRALDDQLAKRPATRGEVANVTVAYYEMRYLIRHLTPPKE